MLGQHCFNVGTALEIETAVGERPISGNYNNDTYWGVIPVNTKHLYNICTMLDQRRGRWADVVQMLYKCFVFTGIVSDNIHADTLRYSMSNLKIIFEKNNRKLR